MAIASWLEPLLRGVRRATGSYSGIKQIMVEGGAAAAALTATGLTKHSKLWRIQKAAVARTMYQLTAAGSSITNTITETVAAEYPLPIAYSKAGKSYLVEGVVAASSTNGTDTLRVQVYVGATTLGGTAVADSTAEDVANNDFVKFRLVIECRSATSWVVSGWINKPNTKAFVPVYSGAVTVTNDVAATYIGVSAKWSVANAGNICAAQQFSVREISAVSTGSTVSEATATLGTDTLTLSGSTAGELLHVTYLDV